MSEHTPTPWKPYEVQVGKGTRRDNLGSESGHVAFFEFEEDCARAGVCVSFFHGRPIATERLEQGMFWEMVDAISTLLGILDWVTLESVADGEREYAKELLTKLGIEE